VLKCPKCESFVKSSLQECPNCGVELSGGSNKKKSSRKDNPVNGKPTDSSSKKIGGVKESGVKKGGMKRGGKKAKIIDKRGEEEFLGMFDDEDNEPVEPKSEKYKLAGVFLILAGIDSIISGIFAFLVRNTITEAWTQSSATEEFYRDYSQLAENLFITFSIVMIIIGILVGIGGYMAFKKKNWQYCMLLAIIGIFSGGFAFTSTILSVVGLVYLIKNRNAFIES